MTEIQDQLKHQELSQNECNAVSGAGFWSDVFGGDAIACGNPGMFTVADIGSTIRKTIEDLFSSLF